MTYAAVAIAGGAIIAGAGTQAYFGNKSSAAAKRAAQAAAEEMRRSKAEAIKYQQPYYQSGTAGLNNLTGLLTGQQYQGGQLQSISDQQRMDLFKKSPGYQFRLDQAQLALAGSQAAKGGLLSGGAQKELSAYTQGIASDEYGNYINQLQGLAGIGQNSANAIGNIEIGAGSQIAGYDQSAGLAQAARYANQGSAISGGFNQIAGLAGGMAGKSGGGAGSSSYQPSSFAMQSAGNGSYNPNYFMNSGMNSINPSLS